jgi:hypothetical protein
MLVSRFALIGLAAAGCFYTDPINQRPSLDIDAEAGPVYRGDVVKLKAVSNDPDGHDVFFTWRAYACTSQAAGGCDQAPYHISKETAIELPIAETRVDVDDPVLVIHVWLEGIDYFGATAKPAQQLWITLDDRAPTLEVVTASSYGYVVDTPITIFARVGDEDDKPTTPQLTWQVFSPSTQPAFELDDFAVTQDPMDSEHITYGKTLTPHGVGEFEVVVTADDGLGLPTSTTMVSKKILVGDDKPPCLRQLTPLVAAAPSAWPMSEPTLFQVHVVADDLDPYPTVSDPWLGRTKFTWSLLAPGSTRQVLTGVTGNNVALDPATYQPGDIVELRVEIADRNNTAITCADASATCSVVPDPNCLQRQTWRVEVR